MDSSNSEVAFLTKAVLSKRYREQLNERYGGNTRLISVSDWQQLDLWKMFGAVRATRMRSHGDSARGGPVRGVLPTLQLLASHDPRAAPWSSLRRVVSTNSRAPSIFRIGVPFLVACAVGALGGTHAVLGKCDGYGEHSGMVHRP